MYWKVVNQVMGNGLIAQWLDPLRIASYVGSSIWSSIYLPGDYAIFLRHETRKEAKGVVWQGTSIKGARLPPYELMNVLQA